MIIENSTRKARAAANKVKSRIARKRRANVRIVGLVPARGGSKGIKGKNLQVVGGLPLVGNSVLLLQAAGIPAVYVSTDDPNIATTASKYGAAIINRPDEISGDYATTEQAIDHFIKVVDCDVVVMVQCTSPMLTAESVKSGLETLLTGGFDSVFSVVAHTDMLLWRVDTKRPEPLNYDPRKRGRRQSRRVTAIVESGGFYIFRTEMFRQRRCRIGGKVSMHRVPFWRSLQIDTKHDLANVRRLIASKYDVD